MFKLSIHENLHRFFKSPRVDFLTIKRRREDLLKSMRMVCIKYVTLCTVNIRTSTTSTPAFFWNKTFPSAFSRFPSTKACETSIYAFVGRLFFPPEIFRNQGFSCYTFLEINKKSLIKKNLPGPHSPHPAPHAFLLVLKPCMEMGKCFLFFFLGSNNPSHLFDMRFIKPNAIN